MLAAVDEWSLMHKYHTICVLYQKHGDWSIINFIVTSLAANWA